MNDTSTMPFSTATPDSAMKPTPAEIDSGMSRSQSVSTPPVSASGTPLKISSESTNERNDEVQQHEDQQQRERHDEPQPLGAGDQLLERAAVLEPVAGRQLDVSLDALAARRRRTSRGRGRGRSPSRRRGACRSRG